MAEDIKMLYDEDLEEFDMSYADGDLVRELGLETAVWMSIFTDRRADDDDVLDDINDRRGWWGDQLNTGSVEEDQIGSKLWQLARAKTTSSNVSLAKQYLQECLQWMIDDEVAEDIEVEVTRQTRDGKEGTGVDSDVMAFKVQVFKADDTSETFKFSDIWDFQLLGI